METKTDASYGVVPVFKKDGVWQVLLIHQISYRGSGDTFWIFPKGHAENGEVPIEAARRELEEETGVTDIEINDSTPITISYSFVHEGIRIEKVVQYYLGVCRSQSTDISQPHEVKELKWCTFEEAKILLTHQNSKDVLEQAQKLLS